MKVIGFDDGDIPLKEVFHKPSYDDGFFACMEGRLKAEGKTIAHKFKRKSWMLGYKSAFDQDLFGICKEKVDSSNHIVLCE